MRNFDKVTYLLTAVLCIVLLFEFPVFWLNVYAIVILIVLGLNVLDKRRYE